MPQLRDSRGFSEGSLLANYERVKVNSSALPGADNHWPAISSHAILAISLRGQVHFRRARALRWVLRVNPLIPRYAAGSI